jgi:hypothetical protein
MLPTVSLRCPCCNARIKAPVRVLGQWRSCPACSKRFLVRARPPQDSGPMLVSHDWEPRPRAAR